MNSKKQKQANVAEEEFEDIVFIGEFKEVCPFCFSGIRVLDDCIIHAIPSCKVFENTECDEFLHRMKLKIKEIAERDRNVN